MLMSLYYHVDGFIVLGSEHVLYLPQVSVLKRKCMLGGVFCRDVIHSAELAHPHLAVLRTDQVQSKLSQ